MAQVAQDKATSQSLIDAKLDRLRLLRQKIVNEMYLDRWLDVWFFPRHAGVAGWEGTQGVMFVGLNPSTGAFPNKADDFLYIQLKAHRFAEAHLTDLIKLRATGQKALSWYKAMRYRRFEDDTERQLLDMQSGYLVEEQAILKARLIVAMGKGRAELLKGLFGPSVRVEEMAHYAPRIRNNEATSQIVSDLGRLREICDHLAT